MKKLIKLIPILFLISCVQTSHTIKKDNLQHIQKNESYKKVKERFSNPPRHEAVILKDSEEYKVLFYDMYTGTVVRLPPRMGPNGLMQAGSILPETKAYVFIFTEDSLIYWGFYLELERSNNDVVLSISEEITKNFPQRSWVIIH